MRITSFQDRSFALGLRRPLRTGAGDVHQRAGRVLLLGDDAGHVGLGEVSPLPGFSAESLDEACEALWSLRLSSLPEEAPALASAIEALSLPSSVAFGLELAALDLLGQRAGRPLAQLLCEEAQSWIPLGQLVEDVPAAERAVGAGVETLKIKVGHSVPEEEDRLLGAIRQAVGPGPRLRLDANRSWTLAQAKDCIGRWRTLGLECIEEPLQPEWAGQLADLCELDVPLVADESVRSAADLETLDSSFAGVVLKPMLIGGLFRSVEMARAAADRGLFVIVTTTLEAAVGRLGVAHVAAACPPEAQRAHGLGTGALLREDLVGTEMDPGLRGGRYTLSPLPGLGLSRDQLLAGEAA